MKRIAIIILSVSLSAAAVFGQLSTGTLRGNVKDITGAVIVGANVTIMDENGQTRTFQTDKSGEFQISDLRPGEYTVVVESIGFAAYRNSKVRVKADRPEVIEVTLNIEGIETEVPVGDDNRVGTAPGSNASAIVLNQEDIEALPDDEEDLAEALRALAGPGAGPSGGQIFVDGFSGGSLPPRDTIREIRINSNPFSSEYDSLGYGRIEIFTRPGTERYRGSFEMEFEDESLNSRNPFLENRPSFQRKEYQFQFGGPIKKERASFFVNLEREDTSSNAFINALVLDSNLNPVQLQTSAPSPSTEFEFDPRIDIQLNESNTLIARYSFERETGENAGLGGFNLLSRAYQDRNSEHTLRITETAVINPTTVNEARFQYRRQRSSETGSGNDPTIRVLDAFTGGGANIGRSFSNDELFEFQNYTSFLLDEHSLKIGGRVRHSSRLDSSPRNFAGTFTFTSLDQYRSAILGNAIPTQFTIAGGDPEASVSQTDYGIFAQNDWRVDPRLTLSFGLRYENQSNISSNFNLAPRVSLAFAPAAGGPSDAKTVFRAGFGIFYDRFSDGLTLQSRRFDGIRQQNYIVEDPSILNTVIFTRNGVSNVPSVGQLSAFAQPQTTRVVSPSLSAPYTAQFAFSVERQISAGTTLSATYLNAQTRRVLRSRNINAPMGGVRPEPGQGNIFQYESTGEFSQNQLILNLRSRFGAFSIFGNYSLNKAESDTDGAGTFPINQYDLTGEFGRSALDSRHRVVMGGSYEAPWDIRIRPFVIVRSGSPFNITTGADSNGDTLFNERPTFAQLFARCGEIGLTAEFCDSSGVADPTQTIPRNYGTGPGFFVTNLRLSKAFEFGTRTESDNSSGNMGRRGGRFGGPFGGRGRRGGPRGGNDSRFSLEFTVTIRNVLNHTNLRSPVGNLRSPFFGRSLSSAGGFGFGRGGSTDGNRRIELELEFEF